MKLAKHIRRLITVYGYRETIIARPKEVREVLFLYKITPSLSQVKQTIHKHTPYILYGKSQPAKLTIFICDCGNPAPHITNACQEAIAAEMNGLTPNYHCVICQLYGEDRYADAHGVVWINDLPACEFNRQLNERTKREDERMRRDMTYAFA